MEEIREVSAGAATFFVWVRNMIIFINYNYYLYYKIHIFIIYFYIIVPYLPKIFSVSPPFNPSVAPTEI